MSQSDYSVRFHRPAVEGRTAVCPATGKAFKPTTGWAVHARHGHFRAWAPLSPAGARKQAPDLHRLAGKLKQVPAAEGGDFVILPTTGATGSAVCPTYSSIFVPRTPVEVATGGDRFVSTRASDRACPGLAAVLHEVLGTEPAAGPDPLTAAERAQAEVSTQLKARRRVEESPAQEVAREAAEYAARRAEAVVVAEQAFAGKGSVGPGEAFVRVVEILTGRVA
jgi:hypothetical protein